MATSKQHHSVQPKPIANKPFLFFKTMQILLFIASSFAIITNTLNNPILFISLAGISLTGFVFAYLWLTLNPKEAKDDYYASKICTIIWTFSLLTLSIYIFMGYTNESVFQFVCVVFIALIFVTELFKSTKAKAKEYYKRAIEQLLNLQEQSDLGEEISFGTLEQALLSLYEYLSIMKSEHTDELQEALIDFKFNLMKQEQELSIETIRISASKVQYLLGKIEPFIIDSNDEIKVLKANKATTNLTDILIEYLQEIENNNLHFTANQHPSMQSQLIEILINLEKEEKKENIKKEHTKRHKAFITFIITFFGIGIVTALLLSNACFEYIYHMLFPTLLISIAGWSYFKIKTLK